MTRMAWMAAMIGVAVLGSAVTVAAQQDGRVFIDINGGIQVTSADFTDNIVFTEFVEEGDLDAAYAISSGVVIDIGGGFKLLDNLGVGVGFSRFDKSHEASVTARVPHPFFFDRHRSISGSATGLSRTETAVHIQVRWFTSVLDQVDLSLFGGPTFFNLTQDLVTGVDFDQSYPFDVASFADASTAQQSKSAVGYHVGADVGFFFSRSVGIGALVRFSRASVDLASEDGGTISSDTGGFQVGGGLRLRF
jgi:hypothetical protein